MSLVITTNVAALNAQRQLDGTQLMLNQSLERLASGLRVNTAKDDAAGLAISEKMRSQIRGFSQARRNAADGISLAQTADGAFGELTSIMIRMRELSVQSANGVLGTGDRQNLQREFAALRAEIDRIVNVVEFNGRKLLDGSLSTGLVFQVGIKNTSNDRITISLATTSAAVLNLTSQTISTVAGAQGTLSIIESAISTVVDRRSRLGAAMNRLQVTMNTLSTMVENLSAANSRIRDADVAAETSELTKSQILLNAGVSVLAQANQVPSFALQLLGGGR